MRRACARTISPRELELELIQTHMAQKPMLRVELGARAYDLGSPPPGFWGLRFCQILNFRT